MQAAQITEKLNAFSYKWGSNQTLFDSDNDQDDSIGCVVSVSSFSRLRHLLQKCTYSHSENQVLGSHLFYGLPIVYLQYIVIIVLNNHM